LHEIQHALHLGILSAVDGKNDALPGRCARSGEAFRHQIVREFKQRAGKVGEGGHETEMLNVQF
jgi:hypothetical protein